MLSFRLGCVLHAEILLTLAFVLQRVMEGIPIFFKEAVY